MAEFQIDASPFFHLLHSFLRLDEIDYDPERIASCVDWFKGNSTMIRKVFAGAEFQVLMTFHSYWDKHKVAPDRSTMNKLIRAQQQCQGMLDTMDSYDRHVQLADDMIAEPRNNLDAYLDERKADYEKWRLSQITRTMDFINETGQQIEKQNFVGPRDALKFFQNEMHKGILLDHVPMEGGVLGENLDKHLVRYAQIESDLKNNKLFLKTGIDVIDELLGGLRRKELNGVLGYVAQRKSAFIRSIGFSAAMNGFRVLHIPLESDYSEEDTAYAVMFAQQWNDEFPADLSLGITKSRVDRSLLNEDEQALYFHEIIPEFADVASRITVINPGATRDWSDIRALIERENDKEPVDLCIIDYLSMLSTPGNRDDIADKIAIVQDAKRLAMNSNGGRGMCILTPVQGNRTGYDEASKNDGAWSTSGIAKYSELDKSLDNCFYVWFNDALNAQNVMKVGSCKTRRAFNIPATAVAIDPRSGQIDPGKAAEAKGEDVVIKRAVPPVKELDQPRGYDDLLDILTPRDTHHGQ